MFIRNLNLFIACLVIAGMTIAAPVGLLVSLALGPILGEQMAGGYLFGYLALGTILAIAWWKTGLSPAEQKPEHKGRFNIGHGLLALTNILAIAAFAGPFLLAKVSGDNNLGMLAWFVLPVFALGFITWPVGLFMVWSSRA